MPSPPPASPTAAAVSDQDRFRIIIGILTAMLLAALDQTIVAPAIPAMGRALGGSDYIPWIISAYFLTATATTPLYGKVADIYGRRSTLFIAIGIFVAGSVLCALATTMPMLILGRAVQGLGGGGLMALAQTVIGDLVPPKERGKYAVYISGTWAIASLTGPILGGVLTQYWHWSMIFWINIPLAAFAVAMTSETLKRLPWAKRDHRLDWPGAALTILATGAFLLALTLAPQQGWTSQPVLGLLAGAGVLAAVLAWHLSRSASPLVPPEVLKNRVVLTATASVFFAMAAFVGLSVYVPVFLQLVLGLDASAAGLALVGYLAGTVSGATFAGMTMAKVKHYKLLPVLGLGLGALGLAWLGWRAPVLGLAETVVMLTLIGIGSGVQFPVTTVAVQNAVDPRDMGVATGVLAFLRALGSSIGVAVVGAVAAGSGIAAGLAGTASTGGAALTGAAFTPVFLAAGLSLALGCAMLALMPELPLRGRDDG